MGHDDWAILRHFQILLLLVPEAKKQPCFCPECGLGSSTCPWAKSEGQEKLEVPGSTGTHLLELSAPYESHTSTEAACQTEHSGSSLKAAGQPCREDPTSF